MVPFFRTIVAENNFLRIGWLLAKCLLFFLVLFSFERLLFVLFYLPEIYNEAGISDPLRLFYKAVPLDLSAAGYFSIIPFLLSLGFLLTKAAYSKKLLQNIIATAVLVLSAISIIIQAAETVAYQEWNSKLSSRVFIHLSNPSEVYRSATATYIFEFAVLSLVLAVGVYFLHKKLFREGAPTPIASPAWTRRLLLFAASLVFYSGLIVILMRGGIGKFPISTSNGYFSKHYIVNDASVNSVWNFGEQWMRYNRSELGDYLANIDPIAADDMANKLRAEDEKERIQVLKTDSINVVFVILESWSAQLVEAVGGVGAPNFSSIADEGILYEKIYSASWTSHKGNASIFSGYPALPGSPIHKFDDRIRELQSIPRALSAHDSRYYYGGDLDFGHISGYLINAGFDQLFDEEQLGELQPRGSLGAHDEATLELLLQEMEKAKTPFFYTLFTLSTHSPYDFPGNESSGGAHEWTNYARSIEYADRQLGEFLGEARQSKVFDNTLFVFVADHGRTNDYNKLPYNDKMYHIPMLWWGGAIREEFKGTKVSKVGSQSDLAKTLLVQLNQPVKNFRFSKDLLNPTSASFAFFEHHHGYGWVTDHGYFSYDMERDVIVDSSFKDPQKLEKAFDECKLYLSAVYRDFIF